MGPPRERGGEIQRRCWKGCCFTLQWGHRANAVESKPLRARCSLPRARFNGATARTRWRVGTRAENMLDMVLLQWGHRANAVESSRRRTKIVLMRRLQWG